MQQKPVLAVAIVTGVILVFIQIIGTCFEPGSQVSRSTRSKAVQPYHYTPSPLEQYFIDNSESLGLHKKELISTCALINDETSPIHKQTLSYFQELDTYNQVLKEFQPIQRDLRADILPGESNIEQVCSAVKIHNNGLQGIFNSGGTSSSTHAGGMEPLLPVMRNHKICPPFRTLLMSMEYLVHDFYSMCKQLKKHSRTVFIDMGASLDFHEKEGSDSPAIYINQIYSKFGFQFDHIYAYEINQKVPAQVYERVRNALMSSYHWINVGVDPEPNGKMNPFTIVLDHFNEDDFVVVKLDIDHQIIEEKLAAQLRNDDRLSSLVDVFYFEHHVMQAELGGWGGSATESVGYSLEMMSDLRRKGVASHYWV
ncbi:hypothetical protein ACHAXN_007809 [Cyclotella atomus]